MQTDAGLVENGFAPSLRGRATADVLRFSLIVSDRGAVVVRNEPANGSAGVRYNGMPRLWCLRENGAVV